MAEAAVTSTLRLRGVRHNNLKNFDLDLPLGRLIAITGLSGSGKSSLAFDTLFAEGQRRYIETFSPYARQFFDRMDKPQVDCIEGIPPAIAIEQRNAVRSTRSTVGTMTEICDYMKMLWPHVAQLHCRQCGRPVRQDTPQQIWRALRAETNGCDRDVLITFGLALSDRLDLAESLELVAKQGYQRLLLDGRIRRLDEVASERLAVERSLTRLTVIQDRLRLADRNRARFIEACEQGLHFGKGKLAVYGFGGAGDLHAASASTGAVTQERPDAVVGPARLFSNRRHCAECDLEYREPSPALFSYNHPLGACPTCKGFGRTISIDSRRAIPDRTRTLAGGAVRPWQSGVSAECQKDLLKFCRMRGVPTDVPFNRLSPEHQRWVIEGDPGYGTDSEHEWPRAWYGVLGFFRWLESKAYKMHVRVFLSRYRSYRPCPDCRGRRLTPEALLYRIAVPTRAPIARATSDAQGRKAGIASTESGLTLADFYALPIQDALAVANELIARVGAKPSDALGLALGEVRARLGYLVEVGLGYLTLDRPTRTLSGGETERVNLTTCLGTRLVNTLFVLDEPTVGLHPRDTARMIRILERLRDIGNTVVVVEHEAAVIRAADHIVDLGPGRGQSGGCVMFQGTGPQLLRSAASLTGQYLSGRKRIETPSRRPVALPSPANEGGDTAWLTVAHANRNNLRDLTVDIPLGRFVCVTGVSGSGKTTLVKDVLLPSLAERLQSPSRAVKASDRLDPVDATEDALDAEPDRAVCDTAELTGAGHLRRVLLVDQSPLGKTPRSNPAVYIGAFDDIREVFAQSDAARQRGLTASAFSFNSPRGQCERCRGAGFEKIEMQFLSDVFIRCPDCDGRRYRAHILEIKLAGPQPGTGFRAASRAASRPAAPGARIPRVRSLDRTRTTGGQSALPGCSWSIADMLDATVDEAVQFLEGLGESRNARRAASKLSWLQQVGLGYLRLGQPINTLSGGESQRLKLVSHLAESGLPNPAPARARTPATPAGPDSPPVSLFEPTLFLFDEPTTGLHFDDVRVLLQVFQRLVDSGHSVLVIEHNLDVIRAADWVIDLGPEAGEQGGQLVVAGTPETVAACRASHTGHALRSRL
ncbi:MAG: excinuclease ABC subunit UvrA [Verrucomicrobia bacterium]|jgi:excinuclease ABC subunit A|nr:excinuclease ABC subunit UvrA [Verrucomicrobiota bacterium]OQC63481.1 MAG: UvrABC system protein A [Verrucomicrobia bacterium ADurb.Bin006]MDI9381245.1 excinuclease ABC subunit UvrA [Verrucomicrobiota bacterium]NMD22001.1 excinuclease ABC subunit UvrA [Verrucomicrobiota bacterium]HOA60258.1 excinuclease ABC subunit UvrA [Verrucomicrobiota bacterium]